ncbi:MAG: GspH/FimT family pseudopilin [Zoogloeaceae bacterium]|jgi:type IV fimbrial biogenesis protein FimT|nr:GspH/FimT family pseudopilin [Zoogloeaceae bacterium]
MRYSRGFTLIELMVAVALVAILLSLAVPSFRDTILKNRVSAATSDLVAALDMARSEAIKRGVEVYLVAPSPGLGGNKGWRIQMKKPSPPLPADPPADAGVLRVREALDQVTVTPTGDTIITYGAQGTVTATVGSATVAYPVTITMQSANCPAGLANGRRKIEINKVGRLTTTVENCS